MCIKKENFRWCVGGSDIHSPALMFARQHARDRFVAHIHRLRTACVGGRSPVQAREQSSEYDVIAAATLC
jgi:hypothetical protein